ncbi:glycosyltransferase family 4 protein [Aquimarina intermedia]|uniref:Glycosyltransferase involved in cell wall biosynthesis n=1 Tax=Aquimarina intermedia TaxID=350814 RepID=A0A5S5BU15_9FLAO|nr:glycosyltransferase family 4 protein [Aquimarina intermedia]TYP70454.1 glycosyltransferase involved in cell wall biosynthesis [Aquimarina intermedia]
MRILHLSAVKNWGGGENHIENLCSELAVSNPEIYNVIFCVKNGAFHRRLKQSNLNYITAILLPKFDPRFFIKLGQTCKREAIDIIHIHDPSAILLAILADKFYKLPPFVFSKKTSFPIKQRKKTLFKYNYPKIKKVLCVSEETKKIASKGIEDKSKLITIYHGTNLQSKSNQTPFLLREKYTILPAVKIIGNIANHIRAKHLDTWIDVADQIINKNHKKDFFFIQIGTFTDRTEDLIHRMKELNLEKHMVFLGYTPNASNYIPQFDISLITSQSEGIPQVIYESLYHKTPVVSTDVGGIPEVIENNHNGFLSPMHEPEQLSQHILNLSDNKELQHKFKENGYLKLINNFTTKNMALQTLQVYKNILQDG